MSEPSRQHSASGRNAICPRCGTAFECGAGGMHGGCWCQDEDYRLPMPSSPTEHCLCQTCLRIAARAESTGLST